MARCCQPLPGDKIVGYVTIGRGVSIHRKDCNNITHASEKQKNRFLEVSWQQQVNDEYVVDILIRAFARSTLLKDITSLFATERAQVYSLDSQSDKLENITQIKVSLATDGLNSLSRIIDKISQVPNVIETRRII